jgi:hypothetical protein
VLQLFAELLADDVGLFTKDGCYYSHDYYLARNNLILYMKHPELRGEMYNGEEKSRRLRAGAL